MNKALVKIDPDKELAFGLFQEFQQRKSEAAKNFLHMGRILKILIKDKHYKTLGFDTVEEMFGSPEISMARGTAYALVHIYEVFIEQHGLDEAFVAGIDYSKLQAIIPLIKSRPDSEFEEWVYKAKELSRSDLDTEIRLAEGKPPRVIEISSAARTEPQLIDYSSYREFVKAHPCIVCGEKEVDPAHFPKTRGAGAPDEWVIPLCRTCHGEYHKDPMDWMMRYRDKWAGYFYKVFVACFTVLSGGKS